MLNRGDAFSIDGRVFKVNWISSQQGTVGLGLVREPDRFAGRLEFAEGA